MYDMSSIKDRFDLFLKASLHYKNRIESLSHDDDMKVYCEITTNFLSKDVSLLEEITKVIKNKDLQSFKDQMDRYQPIICLAITCYLKDLQSFKEKLPKKFEYVMLTSLQTVAKEIEAIEELKASFCR